VINLSLLRANENGGMEVVCIKLLLLHSTFWNHLENLPKYSLLITFVIIKMPNSRKATIVQYFHL
jgi:hypothetical protein